MIVFGIHRNFFIVLPIQLKTCGSDCFFLFYKGKCVERAQSASGLQFVQAWITFQKVVSLI